jgi:hypothetical protein
MSHIVKIQTEIRDRQALDSACRRLQIALPQAGTFQVYQVQATGLKVDLPHWKYPVVCDLLTGELHYDNYGGRWGEESQLHQLLQTYAVEKTCLEARKQGYSATEQILSDGTIKVTVNMAA